MITRRAALAAGSSVFLARPTAAFSAGPYTAKHITPPDWYWRAMRWLTMNLVQDDPGKVDLDFWLDYLKRAHVDAASWNSGGIVGFYPTTIPHHKRNALLGNSDPLGYLIEGCRKIGLIVTTRVDHHATYPETARARPDWISIDENGKPRRHWATPELFLTCTLGPYNEELMTSVMRELVTMYRVDGFNHNRWAPQAMCYCEWCKSASAERPGGSCRESRTPQTKPGLHTSNFARTGCLNCGTTGTAKYRRLTQAPVSFQALGRNGMR